MSRGSLILIDAGGGTIDLSTYRIIPTEPPSVEELSVPGC